MSDQKFIQLKTSSEAFRFINKHPRTFRIFLKVVEKALKNRGIAQLGFTELRLSKDQWNREKKKLVKYGLIQIIETCRSRKTKKSTTFSTMLKPINSFLCDCVYFLPRTDLGGESEKTANRNEKSRTEARTDLGGESEKTANRSANQSVNRDIYNITTYQDHRDCCCSQNLDSIQNLEASTKRKFLKSYTCLQISKAFECLNAHKASNPAAYFRTCLEENYTSNRIPQEKVEKAKEHLRRHGIEFQEKKGFLVFSNGVKISLSIDIQEFTLQIDKITKELFHAYT